jgi:2-amino-4-hydroxy-6-hydroxymethyldihydropteridine diphosphokinase
VSEIAFLGLGSNLGDRLAHLQRAVTLLAAEPGITPLSCSRVWETDPVGGPPQPDFLNIVLRVETRLSPHELLDACRRVESALDRVRDVRWGPRTIDVDILLIDDEVLEEPTLTVPHPRLAERAFVVLPLLELDPDPVLPGGVRLLDLPAPHGDAHPAYPPLRLP